MVNTSKIQRIVTILEREKWNCCTSDVEAIPMMKEKEREEEAERERRRQRERRRYTERGRQRKIGGGREREEAGNTRTF